MVGPSSPQVDAIHYTWEGWGDECAVGWHNLVARDFLRYGLKSTAAFRLFLPLRHHAVFIGDRFREIAVAEFNEASGLLVRWDWPKSGRADTNTHEIKIEDYEISWNLEGGESFAISPTSINEAGCIHTTQGLEFEYVGVIIGDDLRFEGGHLVLDFTKRAKTDSSIKGLKKMSKTDPERAQELGSEIIKNTYRTLMTRGMRGCYVYATDPALREYLKRRAAGVGEG